MPEKADLIEALIESNDKLETDIARMGCPLPDFGSLWMATMIETLLAHTGLLTEARATYEERRAETLEDLLPKAVEAVKIAQKFQEEQEREATERRLGIIQ